MNVGGGVLDAPQVSSLSRGICRAASPLAAVAVCGGGKVCGRDESLPYELTVKGIWRQGYGRHICRPYKAAVIGIGGSGELPNLKRRKGRWR